jgi:hypothetical protein
MIVVNHKKQRRIITSAPEKDSLVFFTTVILSQSFLLHPYFDQGCSFYSAFEPAVSRLLERLVLPTCLTGHGLNKDNTNVRRIENQSNGIDQRNQRY